MNIRTMWILAFAAVATLALPALAQRVESFDTPRERVRGDAPEDAARRSAREETPRVERDELRERRTDRRQRRPEREAFQPRRDLRVEQPRPQRQRLPRREGDVRVEREVRPQPGEFRRRGAAPGAVGRAAPRVAGRPAPATALLNRLNLEPEQRRHVRQLMQRRQQHMNALRERIRATRQEAAAARSAGDERAERTALEELQALLDRGVTDDQVLEEVRSILTPQQNERLNDLLAERERMIRQTRPGAPIRRGPADGPERAERPDRPQRFDEPERRLTPETREQLARQRERIERHYAQQIEALERQREADLRAIERQLRRGGVEQARERDAFDRPQPRLERDERRPDDRRPRFDQERPAPEEAQRRPSDEEMREMRERLQRRAPRPEGDAFERRPREREGEAAEPRRRGGERERG